ncbi:uncharacterized [Tachysurus ichikawai]
MPGLEQGLGDVFQGLGAQLFILISISRSRTTLSNWPEAAKDNLFTAITSHHTTNQTPMAPLPRSLAAQLPSCTQSIR